MDELNVISVELNTAGPRGFKGDPSFIQFHIANGCLIVEQAYENYEFIIVNGDLVVQWR